MHGHCGEIRSPCGVIGHEGGHFLCYRVMSYRLGRHISWFDVFLGFCLRSGGARWEHMWGAFKEVLLLVRCGRGHIQMGV